MYYMCTRTHIQVYTCMQAREVQSGLTDDAGDVPTHQRLSTRQTHPVHALAGKQAGQSDQLLSGKQVAAGGQGHTLLRHAVLAWGRSHHDNQHGRRLKIASTRYVTRVRNQQLQNMRTEVCSLVAKASSVLGYTHVYHTMTPYTLKFSREQWLTRDNRLQLKSSALLSGTVVMERQVHRFPRVWHRQGACLGVAKKKASMHHRCSRRR